MTSTDVRSLVDVCDPMFQFACSFNRAVRDGQRPAPALAVVRAALERVFRNMATLAVEAGQEEQYDKVRPVLAFFIDLAILTSPAPWRADWPKLSEEDFGEQAPGTQFFVLLRETEADRSDDATERLKIFYTCLCLGFEGQHRDDPGQLHIIMEGLANRLNMPGESEMKRPVCGSDAHRPLPKMPPPPPDSGFAWKTLAFVAGGLVASVGISMLLYSYSTSDVRKNINLFNAKYPTIAESRSAK